MNTVSFFRFKAGISIFYLSLGAFGVNAQAPADVPKFDEIYKLLQQHMIGLKAEELDRAATRGLLSEMKGRVAIVTNGVAAAPVETNTVAKSALYDKSYAYLRLKQVGSDVVDKFSRSLQDISTTNKVKGIVIDLRFAEGEDYAAAAAIADKFVSSEQPLLDWGIDSAKAKAKTSYITVPVTVLVNEQTRGAAEALAAILRETKVGLLLGSTTAGEASIFKEFTLQNGQKLRIAVSPIKAGNEKTIPVNGLKPDIEIPVGAEEERAYLEDPYVEVSKAITSVKLSLDTNTVATAETNQARTRLNEAELVRRHREGLSADEEFVEKPTKDATAEIRLVQDPVLSRALDLLKGLAVVQQNRPL